MHKNTLNFSATSGLSGVQDDEQFQRLTDDAVATKF